MSMKSNNFSKAKVRATPEWRQLRIDLSDEYWNYDPITNKPLRKGFNVHHMRLDPEKYGDLEQRYFLPLNKQTHEFLHWAYRYARNDEDFMKRLCYFVGQMVELNKD